MNDDMRGAVFVGGWLFLCWVFELRGEAAGLLCLGIAAVWGLTLSNKDLKAANRELQQKVETLEQDPKQKRFNLPL